MKISKETNISIPFASLSVGIVALLITFFWLFYVFEKGYLINRSGFYVGIYALVAAFYVQYSPRFNHILTLGEEVESRIPISLYIIGSSTIFYAIRITEIDDGTLTWINPFAGAIANSLVVALVTGWVVLAYLNSRTNE